MTETSTRPARTRPLEGIRIIECGVWHAGPGADAILGDLGAEVIKIESMAGEPERAQKAIGGVDFKEFERKDWSVLYEISNRNKKGLCMDVGSPEGLKLLHRLVASADIFSTNLRTSTKQKLGIDYESLSRVNPKIIHMNVSGFGATGPMAMVGGFDPMGQAVSGMLFLGGSDEPVMLHSLILDQLCSITASHAILTALVARDRDGMGQEVHTSLYGSATWLMYTNVLTASILGRDAPVKWGRSVNTPLRNHYKCRDGLWVLGTNSPEDKYWPKFCALVSRNDLLLHPYYASGAFTKEDRMDLIAVLDDVFLQRDQAQWLILLRDAGLNFAPIQRVSDVINDPQALANHYIVDFDHPHLGTIRMPGYPVSFSKYDAGPMLPAPQIGEHTDQILSEIGCSEDHIAALKERKIAR